MSQVENNKIESHEEENVQNHINKDNLVKREKKPLNPFMLYCKEVNKKLLEEGKKVTLKILGEKWNEVNKEHYIELYNENKKKLEENSKLKKSSCIKRKVNSPSKSNQKRKEI
jgi:hypothetical protein